MRQFPLLTLLFVLLGLPASAQVCDCVDDGNCPFVISPNATTQVCYDLTDAFNNNLADPAQGVCGLSINFQHQTVAALNLTLTSPAGQTVQLTGTTGTCNPFTLISNWDVLFIPCSETCAPDTINGCPMPCQWDNCPTGCLCPGSCNWPNAQLTGSYLPYSGCLEDFNLGPANGQWCIDIENGAQFNGGAILDFQVILCDDSGLMCCEADAGNLAFEPDVNACVGDSALLLTPEPMYGAVVPDTLEYGYTFLIFENGEIIAYDTLTDLRTYPVGAYEICGLSYLELDEAALPPVGTMTTAAAINANLNGPSPDFCGDIETNCITVNISTPPPPANLSEIICRGDTVFIGTEPYTQTGVFADTLNAFGGCDSIVNLDLTVIIPDTTDLTETICASDTFMVGTEFFTTTGMYEIPLQNQFQCDSLVRLDLTVLLPIDTSLTDTICQGESLFIGTTPYNSTGIFEDTLTSLIGCDSIVNLDLTVILHDTTDLVETICEGSTFTVGTEVFSTTGMYGVLLQNQFECDSLVRLDLSVLSFIEVMVSDTLCEGETFFIGTEPYSETGIYGDTLTSSFGCDSIVNLDLTIVIPDTTDLTETICASDTFMVGMEIFTTTGMYDVLLQNQFGCDSLVRLGLTVLDPIATSLTDTICMGDTIFIGTEPYTQTGMYLDTLPSFQNCDSIISLDLTVVALSLNIDEPDTLSCESPQVSLSANGGTSLGTLIYSWTHLSPPGNGIVSGGATPGPTVNAPGFYEVLLTSMPTGCTLTDTVEVFQDANLPQANPAALPPATLTCTVTEVTLDGSGSTSGGGMLEYLWTTPDGNILPPANTATATVDEPGNYLLTITDTGNGCTDTTSVTIVRDTIPPSANAGMDGELSCTVASLQLDGSGSTSASGSLGFQWAADPGNILPPANIAGPMVDEPGNYILTVTDPMNGCADTDTVFIGVDTQTPQAIIGLPGPDSLTCVVDSVFLDGSGSLNTQNATFEWLGPIAGGQGTDMATATQPGTYGLALFDTVNGCTDTTFVTIIEYENFPTAEAGPGNELDCGTIIIQLDGNASSFGANFAYEWTSSPEGSFTQPTDTTITVVDSAGIYYLTVTDIPSGCTAIDSVVVNENFTPLIADAGPDGVLDCQDTTFLLDGSNSTLGGFIQDFWYTGDGTLISTMPSVEVNFPDTFFLVLELALCSDTDMVVVTQIAIPPTALAGADMELDCLTGEATLDGSASDMGPNFSYEWATPDGNISTGETTLAPTVDEPGTYILTLTDGATTCTAIDTALVTLDSSLCMPSANAGADGLINCFGNPTQTTLSAGGSMGPNFSYVWTAISPPPADVLDQTDPFAPVVTAGTFVFAVTNDALGLSAFDTVTVVADTVAPSANLAGGPMLGLTCAELAACTAVEVTGTSTGADFTYLWESLDGTICTDPTELNAEILGAGLYTLFVTDTTNGCAAEATIIVQLAGEVPSAEAGTAIQMACGDVDTTLMGMASPSGQNIVTEWFSPGGDIISGGDTPAPTVAPNNPQDTFFMVVENMDNLCRDTDFVVVFAPVNCAPDCAASTSGPIGCVTDTVALFAEGSSMGLDITYLWSALSGNLCGGEMADTACADQPGFYELTVTRTYPNGSTFEASCQVQIFDESDPPLTDAGANMSLNCAVDSLELDGTASASGQNIVYAWDTSTGNILSGANTITPTVNAPGLYTLTVTDTLTGCSGSDFTLVGLDTMPPTAEAGPDGIITCGSNQTTLNGSGMPGIVMYEWTTDTGSICGGGFSPTPSVCADGIYFLTVTNPQNGCAATDSVVVEADEDVPDVNVGTSPLNFTCVDTVFTITATASGVGPLTYQWAFTPPAGGAGGACITGPTDVLEITVECPGIYTLTVSDLVNGCTAIGEVEVLDNTTPPVANAGMDAEINCQNLTAVLDGNGSTSASGNLEWQWTTVGGNILPPANEASATVDSAGIYTLTVTDPTNGCMDSTTVEVTRDADIPMASAGPDTTLTCTRLELDLDGTGSTMGANMEYSWAAIPGNITVGGTTLTPTIDAVGTYVLEVTDNASLCVVTDTVIVTQDLAQPTANIDLSGNLTITCEEPQVVLNGSAATPMGNVAWAWTTTGGNVLPPANTATANVDETGVYTLTVTHLRTGCTDEVSVTVGEDTAEPFVQILDPERLTCDSTTVTLTALPPDPQPVYEFLWNGPGLVSDDNLPSVTVDDTGLYSVTITDLTNGCEGDTSVVVTSDFSVPTAVATALGQLDCDHLTALVSGDGSTMSGVDYAWTTTSAGSIFSPNAQASEVDAAGWYFLTVKKLVNGCTATDSAEVVASSLPITEVLLSLEHPTCTEPEGAIFIDTVFGGTPPFIYSLNGEVSITFPIFNYLAPGAYGLLVEDVNGCTWEAEVSILLPNEPLIELGADLNISNGETTVLTAQASVPEGELASVVWTGLPDSVDCPACLTQEVSPTETTTYRIFVTDTTGCRAEDRVTVFVDEQPPFYVPTAFSPNGDNVNDLFLLYAGPDILRVPNFRIFDRWGNMVFFREDYQPNNPQYGWDGKFEGQEMNPAVFVWKAEVEFVDGIVEVFYGEFTLVR